MDRKHTDAQLLAVQGNIEKGRHAEAIKILDGLRASPIEDAGIHCRIGDLYARMGEYPRAAEYFVMALSAQPQNQVYLNRLANVYLSLNELQQAERFLVQSQAIDADNTDTLVLLGTLCLLAGEQFGKAIEFFERALPSRPRDVLLHSNLAISLNQMGQHDRAIEHANIAKRLDPRNPQVYNVIGMIQLQMGQSEDAVVSFKKAITINPKFYVGYFNLSTAKKFKKVDAGLIEAAATLMQDSMPAVERISLCFALGKMLDDIDEPERSYHYYQQGNLLSKKPLVETGLNSRIKRQKALCNRDYLLEQASCANQSDVPVFIVGMPRSGTTLIEQIIASHPQAAGAGELTYIREIADDVFDKLPVSWSWLGQRKSPETAMLERSALSYLKKLCSGHEDALRITDKMPTNYMFLGLIALLFPRAKIIHAVRHPLDTCLSCYFQPFKDQQWSFDLLRLVETYKNYRALMDDWKRVLPSETLVEVRYEQLVADTEEQSKRIVTACGLEWDSVCLDFYYAKRSVMTASMWQVRQPIYQSSKMRWLKYAPYIGELAKGLNEYLDDNDRELLREHGGIDLKPPKRLGFF